MTTLIVTSCHPTRSPRDEKERRREGETDTQRERGAERERYRERESDDFVTFCQSHRVTSGQQRETESERLIFNIQE